MTGTTHRCDSKETWNYFIENCANLRERGEVRSFQIINPKNRSLSQNDMKEQQVKVLADQLFDGDERKARNSAKFYCGCPILIRDDERFAKFCKEGLGHLSTDEKIEAMDFVPVTRLMTVTQMREYIDKVFDRFAESVDWGELITITPDKLYGK